MDSMLVTFSSCHIAVVVIVFPTLQRKHPCQPALRNYANACRIVAIVAIVDLSDFDTLCRLFRESRKRRTYLLVACVVLHDLSGRSVCRVRIPKS